MKIKIVNTSRHPLPEYATVSAAGMDLRANLAQPVLQYLRADPCRRQRPWHIQEADVWTN